ncbi:MAG: methyltransferase domain-containing protein [Deltaproteobacteria bacterium]|nr:methyltransferase domain-containing protein [Deltaproteobacteria bacterium]
MRVKEYFEKCADRFDGFYKEERRGAFQQAAHAVFRKPGLVRRFQATVDFLGDVTGKTILDVGCGSGIYSIYFARQGAKVMGLDFSSSMLALARKNAAEEGCAVEFVPGDFLAFEEGRRFDHLLFIGVFDYVKPEDLPAYFEKAAGIADGKIVATFPRKYAPQSLIRYCWLRRQDCPVYFYTRKQVESLGNRFDRPARFRACGPIWTVAFEKRTA